MSREWKPGDVALLYWHDERGRVVSIRIRENAPCGHGSPAHWHTQEGMWGSEPDEARPLVVIDPEDAEQVERLADAYHRALNGGGSPGYRQAIAAALREFANPTPPKPDEPMGLGAVVEDAEGEHWTRLNGESTPWARSGRFPQRWRDLNVVRVLSEGVSPEATS